MECPKCKGEMRLTVRNVGAKKRGTIDRLNVKNWQCQSCRLWRGSIDYWRCVRRNVVAERKEREDLAAKVAAEDAGFSLLSHQEHTGPNEPEDFGEIPDSA